MSHGCSAILVRCIDFRLTHAVNKWLIKNRLMDDCDIISVAGSVKTIAEDLESTESQWLIKQIKLSVSLHQSRKLYLLHHTDCGAYGGCSAFDHFTVERKRHRDDMRKAKIAISSALPNLEIKTLLADIQTNNSTTSRVLSMLNLRKHTIRIEEV